MNDLTLIQIHLTELKIPVYVMQFQHMKKNILFYKMRIKYVMIIGELEGNE